MGYHIPNDLILYINPSCQSLSKALKMSKKIPQLPKEDCSQMICRCHEQLKVVDIHMSQKV